MPFYCALCKNEEESCYVSPLCSKCIELKKIVSLYGIEKINKTLSEIFIRHDEAIDHRTKIIKKTPVPVHININEEDEGKPNTRSRRP